MNKRNIRFILAGIIGLIPTNTIRCFLYRALLGYAIRKSTIGWATFIVVESAKLTECSVGSGNKFIGPMRISIQKGANIGHMNTFICGRWTKKEKFESVRYDRSLDIGMNALITSNHFFDVVGSFSLGENSWIAGRGSHFWTHGARVNDRNISIGNSCYIGSSVRFAPGTSVGDNCVVGLGSILTKKYDLKNAIIAGNPAKILRENYDWTTKTDIC